MRAFCRKKIKESFSVFILFATLDTAGGKKGTIPGEWRNMLSKMLCN